jgi:hypothetical protein
MCSWRSARWALLQVCADNCRPATHPLACHPFASTRDLANATAVDTAARRDVVLATGGIKI